MKIKRKRYIVLEIDKVVDRETFHKILIDNILFLVGILGLSLALPSIVYLKNKLVVVRTSLQGLEIIRGVLALKDDLNGYKVRIIKVTGSFKKAKSICDSYKIDTI
ncbi:MAG: Rpp14/Pop5 family protein [Thermoproteales archaeon]|nr:Rpp14/Pop5 family protein [Thermoproteales archaeon]